MAEVRFTGTNGESASHGVDNSFLNLGLYELKTKFHQNGNCVTHRIPFTNDRTHNIRSGIRSEKWRNIRRLGEGGFGIVRLQKREQNGAHVTQAVERAVKEIRLDPTAKSIDPRREIDAMITLSKNKSSFVQIEGWYQNDACLYIAMEYFQLGDLRSCISGPLPENEAQVITAQVTEGVKFMHEKNLVHRDLKPENILVAASGPAWWVKIADFGISKRFSERTECRTALALGSQFAAPELIQLIPDPVTTCADMWSVGCLVVWLVTSKNVFEDTGQYCKFALGNIDFSTQRKSLRMHLANDGMDFVSSTLCPAPEDRLNAQEALNHRWLQNLSTHIADTSSTFSDGSDSDDDAELQQNEILIKNGSSTQFSNKSENITLLATPVVEDDRVERFVAEVEARDTEREAREKEYLAQKRGERDKRFQNKLASLAAGERLADEAEAMRQERLRTEGPDLEAYQMFYALTNGKLILDRIREINLGDFTKRRASSPYMSVLRETSDRLGIVSHQRAKSDSFYR